MNAHASQGKVEGGRFAQLQLGTALFVRAAMDAWTGLQTRDVQCLASAQFCARTAVELCFSAGKANASKGVANTIVKAATAEPDERGACFA